MEISVTRHMNERPVPIHTNGPGVLARAKMQCTHQRALDAEAPSLARRSWTWGEVNGGLGVIYMLTKLRYDLL